MGEPVIVCVCVCVYVCYSLICFTRVQLSAYRLEKTVHHSDAQGESFVRQNQILCVIYTQMCIMENTALLFAYSQQWQWGNDGQVAVQTGV